LSAALQAHNPAVVMLAHRVLGYALAEADRTPEALPHLHRSLILAEDPTARAMAHHSLARAQDLGGNQDAALDELAEALRLYRVAENEAGEARAANDYGWLAARLGGHAEAREHCETALALFCRQGSREGQAASSDTLGWLAHHTGAHEEAITHYGSALGWYHEIGDVYATADTHDHLGEACLALGDHGQAREHWLRALHLYQAQHRRNDAERVSAYLDSRIVQGLSQSTPTQ
jgi:tetratricopeptide (TPR) repeat protein